MSTFIYSKYFIVICFVYRTLVNLRACYEEVFTQSCGQSGGGVIGGLMTKAFQDPFYLRYKYKPDCDLHKTTISTAQASHTKVTTLKPHHRTSKTERSKALKTNEALDAKPSSYKHGKSQSSATIFGTPGILLVLTALITSLQWDTHNR